MYTTHKILGETIATTIYYYYIGKKIKMVSREPKFVELYDGDVIKILLSADDNKTLLLLYQTVFESSVR